MTTNLTNDNLAYRATELMKQAKTAGQAAKILNQRGFRTVGGSPITKSAIYNARSKTNRAPEAVANTTPINAPGGPNGVNVPSDGIWINGATSTTRVLPFSNVGTPPETEDKTTIAVTRNERDLIELTRGLSSILRGNRKHAFSGNVIQLAVDAYKAILLDIPAPDSSL